MGTLLENHKMYRKGYQTGYHEGWFEAKERLKADMVAMLTEIQLEMDELQAPPEKYLDCYYSGVVDCRDVIIQQKINALKAESEG